MKGFFSLIICLIITVIVFIFVLLESQKDSVTPDTLNQ